VTPAGRTAAAVLAAGRGVRLGGDVPKPLVALGGRPLVEHAVAAAVSSGLRPVLCVVADDRVDAAVPAGADVLRNDEPERGIASTLQVVLRALSPRAGIDAVVVGLGDQPLVGAEAYRRVAAAEGPLAVATYGGEHGNPVKIARELWDEALALEGDEGARVLIRRHGAMKVSCEGTGEPTDIDTPEDLAALERRWRSQTVSE
jgi:CTP:molybdopterin cytidylyltransferase MocA